jgi:hypothetical protein
VRRRICASRIVVVIRTHIWPTLPRTSGARCVRRLRDDVVCMRARARVCVHRFKVEGGYVAFCERFAPRAAALGRRRAGANADVDGATADDVTCVRALPAVGDDLAVLVGGGGGGGDDDDDDDDALRASARQRRRSLVAALDVSDVTSATGTGTGLSASPSAAVAAALFEPHAPPVYVPMLDVRYRADMRIYHRQSSLRASLRSMSTGTCLRA